MQPDRGVQRILAERHALVQAGWWVKPPKP